MIRIKGDVGVKDRPKAGVQKPRTASPSLKAAASGGKGPPKKPPVVVAAAAPEGPDVRLIFPASVGLKDRLEASWHRNKDRSLSAAIRRLLERALLDEGAEK